MRNQNFTSFAHLLGSAAIALLLTGCGLGGGVDTAKNTGSGVANLAVTGRVHGGQQPIGNATINMYAVGLTGYGSPSVSILKNGVTIHSATDGSGSFSLSGQFTCTPEQRIYITATGGDAGSGVNSAIALMAALGRCGDLTASTFISLNEVTTVASVWALAPFMNGIANIGTPSTNVTGLNNAFSDVNTLANISTGSAGGPGSPSNATIPVSAINTLADILAACINSNGTDLGCSTLFSGATVGSAPTDTLTAALNIAQHPANGIATLFPLATPQSPFQPKLQDQPGDFTLAATFSGFTAPASAATDANGSVWIADPTANTLTQLAHNGAPILTASNLHAPSAVAVDQSGNAWVANAGNSSVTRVTTAGTISSFTGGGLNAPRGISIDGQGNIWLANSGGTTASEFDNTGTPLSGTGYSAGGTPIAIGINPN